MEAALLCARLDSCIATKTLLQEGSNGIAIEQLSKSRCSAEDARPAQDPKFHKGRCEIV